MCTELGITLDDIVVSGGGSGSDLFMGILADVFGAPTTRNVDGGGAALGAAICAAVATDVHPDFETAVAAMSNQRESFVPDHQRAAVYRRLSDTVYQGIRDHTDALFERSYPIFH
jgi:sugar (pentulose or hexulose) kinase